MASMKIYSEADTYCKEYAPDTNSGGSVAVWGGYKKLMTPSEPHCRGFLRFNLADMPSSGVTKVELKMHAGTLAVGWSGADPWKLHKVADDAWDEMVITWNTGMPVLGDVITSPAYVTPCGFYVIDVTTYVVAEKAGDGKASFGMSVDEPVGATDIGVCVSSKETVTGEHKPYLEVTYGAVENPPHISTVTPTWGYKNQTTPIHIYGSDFQATPTVKINGTDCTNEVWVNSGHLTCTVPAIDTVGYYDIKVINPDTQEDTLENAFQVRTEAPPVASEVTTFGVQLGFWVWSYQHGTWMKGGNPVT